ncbi:peptidase M15D vanX D-ala-D-ala dipeptidase [Stanieria cyanosphaera PCC 7437]|uniref:D-alanyl-D-alanine dipeptidase n=1 Tax=Stanieria cyanosphaera (strain ATCC 29371 / PCC 7437) TaxID=111780 RepID=K9XNZ4_STAC7|nr:M15 family metallopeptidase [Stanieria cyanosphaera]AFZ33804.1 peptidase M15D vanX D-ala-D-ala dipeptidase [Stanieria cyanosphaera PCC 7437]
MNSYQQIPIEECGEPLVPIPLEKFAVELPHPYERLGANYGERSPYCLRQGVVTALEKAQFLLNKSYPGWKLKIFDAYRTVGVQQFMVDYTYGILLKRQGLPEHKLSPQQRQKIWDQVYQLWAAPSLDPLTPPPHSTGAAIDLTLIDDRGITLDLGGQIDEISPRSHPDYYAKSQDIKEQQFHRRRQLLERVMLNAGFSRHPREWWHFSLGDQMWAWLHNQNNPNNSVIARYGRI